MSKKTKQFSQKRDKIKSKEDKKKIVDRQNMNNQRPDFYGEIGGD